MCFGGTGVVTTGDQAAILNGADPSTLKSNPLNKPPPLAPDMTDDAVMAARRAAARRISGRQGLQSTFTTTPMLGSGGMLGGGS